MAKAAKKTADVTDEPAEAAIIPAPLAEAVEEQDSVLQAHFTRQETHFVELAPSVAKQAREDAEREAMLQEQELIAERNRKEREEQAAKQREIEERETATTRIVNLTEEIDALNASLKEKTAEVEHLKQLVKE